MTNTWKALLDAASRAGVEEQVRLLNRRALEDRCSVAFLGEFSRGKSTLINRLIAVDILPADVRPTSAGVVCIVHGDSPSARLHQDGEARALEPTTAGLRCVQTEESGGLASGAPGSWVDLALPLPPDLQAMRLIDTPGVNDLTQTDPDLTYRLLPFVDVLVFVLDAGVNLTQSEALFMQAQLERCPDISALVFFNLMDKLSVEDEGELQEFYAELEESIHDTLGPQVSVLFGSAVRDLGPLRDALLACADASTARRKVRLERQAAATIRQRTEQERQTLDMNEGQRTTALASLRSTAPALTQSFGEFCGHLRQEGEVPLCGMVDASLSTWKEQAERDLVAQLAMAGNLQTFAKHGLNLAAERMARQWCDRHVPIVRRFLRRHAQMAILEARRHFGGQILVRFDPGAVMLAVAHARGERMLEVAGMEDGHIARYGLAAVGSAIGGLIAAPLSIVGLGIGLAIAEGQRKQREATLRDEIEAAIPGVLTQFVDELRRNLMGELSRHFQALDVALKQCLVDQLREAEALLASEENETSAAGIAREERRQEITRAEGILDELQAAP